jgi:hypothetical protein
MAIKLRSPTSRISRGGTTGSAASPIPVTSRRGCEGVGRTAGRLVRRAPDRQGRAKPRNRRSSETRPNRQAHHQRVPRWCTFSTPSERIGSRRRLWYAMESPCSHSRVPSAGMISGVPGARKAHTNQTTRGHRGLAIVVLSETPFRRGSSAPVAGMGTLSEGFRRCVALPPFLVGYC